MARLIEYEIVIKRINRIEEPVITKFEGGEKKRTEITEDIEVIYQQRRDDEINLRDIINSFNK